MKAKSSVVLVVFALAAMAAASNNKLAPELQQLKGSERRDVIVQFKTPLTAKHHQSVVRRGGELRQELKVIRGAVYSVPSAMLTRLAEDPAVAYISPDRPLKGAGISAASTPTATTSAAITAAATLDYHTDTINAPYAWELGLDGTGVGVAVLDSGITDLEDLRGNGYRVVYNQDFVGDGDQSATDLYGHGSHVAGIIGGDGKKSSGPHAFYTFEGIAPNVNLINLRVLDQNGEGTDSGVISAIEAAISLKAKYNILVVNLSLGRPIYESYLLDPLCQAVEAAYQAGIVVVVSAGNNGRDNSWNNDGYGTITAPGNDPYVITVGAMKTMGTPSRTDDLIATYSSKGPTAIDHIAKPDLVAPGNLIISLYSPGSQLDQMYPNNEIPTSLYKTNGNNARSNTYYLLSGTSMAAPMVSGTAALMLQQNPALSPDQVKAALMKSASKTFPLYSSYTDPATGITYTDQYDVFTVGAGYLDIEAALANQGVFSGVATSPMVAYDPVTQGVYFVNNSFAVWGGSADWSSFAVWGGNAFVGSDFAVWGGSSAWASFAVWGGSAPWGDSTDNGFFAVWGGSTVGSDSTSNTESLGLLINGDN